MTLIKKAHWYHGLKVWSRSILGRAFFETESAQLEEFLSTKGGHHLVHIGVFPRCLNVTDKSINHSIHVMPVHEAHKQSDYLISSSQDLPFATDSVDIVILQHCLEFTRKPHDVIREAHRILRAEGYLVICGFNPWSIWGLWRLFAKWFDAMPWAGRFMGITRLRDWTGLLGLDEESLQRYFFRPPVSHVKLLSKLAWLEKLEKLSWPFGGAGYVYIVKKRVVRLTPIRPWADTRQKLAGANVLPTTFQQKRDTQ